MIPLDSLHFHTQLARSFSKISVDTVVIGFYTRIMDSHPSTILRCVTGLFHTWRAVAMASEIQ